MLYSSKIASHFKKKIEIKFRIRGFLNILILLSLSNNYLGGDNYLGGAAC